MKVSFVRHSLLNRGGDKIVLEYAGHLAGKGHDVTIWTNRVDTIFEIAPLIKIRSLPFKSKLGTILSSAFIKFPSDIVIADIIAIVFFLSFRNHPKIIYFAQDYDESYYRSKLLRFLVRMLYIYSLRAKKIPVIAESYYLTKLLYDRFKAKIKTVPYGINFDEFYHEEDEELVTQKNGRKAVLIFARSDYRKGLDIALDVLNDVSKRATRYNMVVWAVGEDVKISGLPVENFGLVKPDRLRRIFSSADIFLFPSRHEGFGLMVLEAMACGCPVLATSAVSIVEDNKDALVSPTEDVNDLAQKLILLLENDSLKKRLTEEGYKTVRKYDLRQSKLEFENILENHTTAFC